MRAPYALGITPMPAFYIRTLRVFLNCYYPAFSGKINQALIGY
jgi:hypothetical protein